MNGCQPPCAEGKVLKRSKESLEGDTVWIGKYIGGGSRDANHLAPVAAAEVVERCWGNILSFTRLPEREFLLMEPKE